MLSLRTSLLLLSFSTIFASWAVLGPKSRPGVSESIPQALNDESLSHSSSDDRQTSAPRPVQRELSQADQTLVKMAQYLEKNPNVARANVFSSPPVAQKFEIFELGPVDEPENYSKIVSAMTHRPKEFSLEITDRFATLNETQKDERDQLLQVAKRAAEVEPTEVLKDLFLDQAKKYKDSKNDAEYGSKALQYYLDTESDPEVRKKRLIDFYEFVSPQPKASATPHSN